MQINLEGLSPMMQLSVIDKTLEVLAHEYTDITRDLKFWSDEPPGETGARKQMEEWSNHCWIARREVEKLRFAVLRSLATKETPEDESDDEEEGETLGESIVRMATNAANKAEATTEPTDEATRRLKADQALKDCLKTIDDLGFEVHSVTGTDRCMGELETATSPLFRPEVVAKKTSNKKRDNA